MKSHLHEESTPGTMPKLFSPHPHESLDTCRVLRSVINRALVCAATLFGRVHCPRQDDDVLEARFEEQVASRCSHRSTCFRSALRAVVSLNDDFAVGSADAASDVFMGVCRKYLCGQLSWIPYPVASLIEPLGFGSASPDSLTILHELMGTVFNTLRHRLPFLGQVQCEALFCVQLKEFMRGSTYDSSDPVQTLLVLHETIRCEDLGRVYISMLLNSLDPGRQPEGDDDEELPNSDGWSRDELYSQLSSSDAEQRSNLHWSRSNSSGSTGSSCGASSDETPTLAQTSEEEFFPKIKDIIVVAYDGSPAPCSVCPSAVEVVVTDDAVLKRRALEAAASHNVKEMAVEVDYPPSGMMGWCMASP